VLRFGQDVAPGYQGIPFSSLDAAAELEGLEVKVSPLIETVPMGAPIRIDFCLANNGSQKMPVPGSLNMKTGHVSGEVIDPSGTKRTFSTISNNF
jgi:hypothetical protein